MSKVIDKIQHEVVAVGGIVIAVGEFAAPLIPTGPVRTVVQVGLPILISIVARAKVMPMDRVNSLLEALRSIKPATGITTTQKP